MTCNCDECKKLKKQILEYCDHIENHPDLSMSVKYAVSQFRYFAIS